MNQQMTRILCVDDEPFNLELLEAILEPRSYDVLLAENGPQALEKIRTERIDICLLDVMMPEMDGFEVCRRIKSDEEHVNIPVIMITAYADKENRIRGIEAGAEDFISKPFDGAEVLSRISMLLKVKQANDQLHSAYHSINRLTNFGKEISNNFNPLHYSFMDNIKLIINQIIAVSPEQIDHPQNVLVSLRKSNVESACYVFGYRDGAIDMSSLPTSLCRHFERLASGKEMVWLNQSDLQDGYQELLAALSEHMKVPRNLICHQSSQITFCALD